MERNVTRITDPSVVVILQEAQRNPEARKLNLKSFINRPISRILRYDLLLKRILGETPENHEDQKSIPEVLPVVRDLNKAMDHAIVAPKRKVEMWRYHRNLVWRPGEEMVCYLFIVIGICVRNDVLTNLYNRTWTFWMRPGLWFIPADC